MVLDYRFASKVALAITVLVCLVVYSNTLAQWGIRWIDEPEYGHGLLLLASAFYIAWQGRGAMVRHERLHYLSVLPLVGALVLYWVGTFAALQLALQLSFIAMLVAIIVAWLGLAGLKPFAFPLLLLGLSIPLPYFIEAQITAKLQLISSKFAVSLIEWSGMPVYLQGNVIDLGAMQLEVVEACSGLRYLYPLLSLGVLASYFYVAPWWRRAFVVLSTIPLTLLMNSARIAVTAWLVDRYGAGAAEGFFHDFEGLVIFLICMLALFVEIALLEFAFGRRGVWQSLDFEQTANVKLPKVGGPIRLEPIMLVLTALLVMTTWSTFERHRERITSEANIAYFPLHWGEWQGYGVELADYKLSRLKVDAYVLANFTRAQDSVPVNLYVAFYGHQSAGISPHSPKVCMPGGGWGITQFDVVEGPLHRVNEVIIERQGEKQLVRYWFVERGVPMVNEYRRKWLLLKDAMLIGRTDGALVRITTPVLQSERISDARVRLQAFEQRIAEPILDYLPAKVSRSY